MSGRLPQISPWINAERQGWLTAGPERPYEQPAWPVRQNPELRIGDLERDRAIADLGEHYAAGRLNREEFDERSDQAMQARRQAELTPLFADLPGMTLAGPAVRSPGRGPVLRWPLFWLAPLLLVVAVVTAVVASAPWLIWMMLTIVLVTVPWRHRRGFGPYAHRHPMAGGGPR